MQGGVSGGGGGQPLNLVAVTLAVPVVYNKASTLGTLSFRSISETFRSSFNFGHAPLVHTSADRTHTRPHVRSSIPRPLARSLARSR